jgi:formylglycine-generating enzyme required for sulfatase activity
MSSNVPEEPAPRKRRGRPQIDQLYETLQQAAPELVRLRTNSVGIKLVLVPEGSFRMGSPLDEPQRRSNEGPPHEVLLTQAVYFGIHPVTQVQYQTVVGRNPSRFHAGNGGGPDHPVEGVSWEDALSYCQLLSAAPQERQAGLSYRLPTEAEWERACRAGTGGPYSFGQSLSAAHANIEGNYPYGDAPAGQFLQRTSRVGSYPANNFGLFDMHGNVWEWCSDWYAAGYYGVSPPRDPQGPAEGTMRVVRGGCWRNHAATCRAAYRNGLPPYNRDPYTGFRVCATVSRST